MEGNPELLRRAIENIVRNAIRYSPEGGRVRCFARSAPASVYRVAVRDFGPGVPEESLPHIFDPFYRVEKDRGRTSGGVGLGLAIAKRAVELHHGSMRRIEPAARASGRNRSARAARLREEHDAGFLFLQNLDPVRQFEHAAGQVSFTVTRSE